LEGGEEEIEEVEKRECDEGRGGLVDSFNLLVGRSNKIDKYKQ
jgi:hypothetical protein